jgi:flagellar motor component MotA
LFKLVTWIVGFAAVVLGFAVKEGFEEGLEKIHHPFMLFILGCAGLAVVVLALYIVRDHGRHINRTLRGPTQREMVSPLR